VIVCLCQNTHVIKAGTAAFTAFMRRKEHAAQSARFESFTTIVDHSASFALEPIGCGFTDALLDGPLLQTATSATAPPAMNLVFVQSAGGNTEADNPSDLGGGDTDKHLIYEGLSRVSSDAVIAGAKTVGDGDVLFSVWHPELVALRGALGKPRHPIQIVVSVRGKLPIEKGLLFNVAEMNVVILTADGSAAALAERTRARPWIHVLSSGPELDLRSHLERLRNQFGVSRISNIGGRTLATAAIDAGLVTDLYLTTSPIEAGTRNTPMYTGTRFPHRELVLRKRSASGVTFEHLCMRR
jgi:riboflavin biosynthesis pyrimidine reductase